MENSSEKVVYMEINVENILEKAVCMEITMENILEKAVYMEITMEFFWKKRSAWKLLWKTFRKKWCISVCQEFSHTVHLSIPLPTVIIRHGESAWRHVSQS